MKINEILVESRMDEGPVGDAMGKVGTGLGKAAGGVAKGIGAVAGGVAGMGSAFKKGFSAGKSTVAGEPDATDQTQTTTSTAATVPSNTVYAQVRSNIDKLDKKGKQRILAVLQKQLGQPSTQPAVAAPIPQTATAKPRTKQPVKIAGVKQAVAQPQVQPAV